MRTDVVVAGHTCLDLIPGLTAQAEMQPGRLVEVGPVCFAPGGAVPNVGLGLATLGARVRLVGRVGDDTLGHVLMNLMRSRLPGDELAFQSVADDTTSYTVIISPPGVDRLFLHHAGCNDRFDPGAIDASALGDARLFYFGYPPAMRNIYADGGTGIANLLQRTKACGLTTALDMSMPDANAESGRQDWAGFLRRVLPYVDIFLPSWEEILYMLDRERFAAGAEPTSSLLLEISERLLGFGSAIVGLKLGRQGIYLRTGSAEQLQEIGRAAPSDLECWAGRELWTPIFLVAVKGTTGAGDATVAGFVAALLRDLGPAAAIRSAAAIGAQCAEAADATSGLRSWEETHARIRSGWAQERRDPPGESWRRLEQEGVFAGPRDRFIPRVWRGHNEQGSDQTGAGAGARLPRKGRHRSHVKGSREHRDRAPRPR